MINEDRSEQPGQIGQSTKMNKGEMEQGTMVLTQDCISYILSLTSPPDAGKSSVVSSVFRSAADSDLVWERFLPSDLQQILSSFSSSSSSLMAFASKKQLYLHLCDNPLLIDNGTRTFALEKCSGKKCYMIGAKGLSIIWGDTPSYWKWRPLPESRFSVVAELLNVCWLQINGKIETRLLSPNTMYGAYLVFKFTDRAHGFEHPAVKVSVKLASSGGGAKEGEVKCVCLNPMKNVDLNPVGGQRRHRFVNRRYLRRRRGFGNELRPEETVVSTTQQRVLLPKDRGDGWMEIEMGEFFNERGEDGEVEMSLMEVDDFNWKSGLIIEGIELRPKSNH